MERMLLRRAASEGQGGREAPNGSPTVDRRRRAVLEGESTSSRCARVCPALSRPLVQIWLRTRSSTLRL